MTTTLLIDADLMAFRAAAGNQDNIDWGDGVVSVSTDIEEAKTKIRRELDQWMADLDATDFLICLSDDFKNFRKGIDPTYKGNRTTVERPELLYVLKDWLYESFPSRRVPTLEADDILGIMSTEAHQGERIMVSQDKDMKTIPGTLYRPYGEAPELLVIDRPAADRYHLYQTLTGDVVDHYPGCPGVGPGKASAALDSLTGWEPYTHVFKSGPRKGLEETRWAPRPFDTPWEVLVSLYAKAGLTEAHALVQARLARILRGEDWDGRRPILWSPS